MLGNIAGNVIGNAAYDAAQNVLPGNEESESTHELLASIHRLLERQLALQLAQNQTEPQRTYYEETITLLPGIVSDYSPDPRRLGYTQVAIYTPVVANLVLRRLGLVDINVALPAAKFTTIQQPVGTLWLLKNTDPQASFTVRYSDVVYGAILP